jgi:thiosulfate dehydrogenase
MKLVIVLGLISVALACSPPEQTQSLWVAPDSTELQPADSLIRYGRELIVRTAYYLGPHGTVAQISNGMNCQNCHLQAGTAPFGNNYGSVASLYPRFRERSGSLESMEKRVNDCIQRSLGGKPIDSLSNEMRALVAYFQWLGSNVPKQKRAYGSGLFPLDFLHRAADTVRGKEYYKTKCVSCHQANGRGVRHPAKAEFTYPPLWGDSSFTTAAGLYRISNFARYIYANMPQGATFETPQLSKEEAWDIAAYVLSKPRKHIVFPDDWPNMHTKPIDHPFGPYADSFPEIQHKYGPFPPITTFYQSINK